MKSQPMRPAAGGARGLFREHWPLAVLFLLALGLRLAILLTSQRYADGDEAVIGMMAKFIFTRGDRPIFFLGQPYAGGGAIEAYLAVLPFVVLGMSSLSLKMVALTVSLATLVAAYAFCAACFGRKAAIIATALLATTTALVEWNTKMRGGYIELPLLVTLLLLLFYRIAHRDKSSAWSYLALGILAGFSFYSQQLIISLLATLLAASLCWRDRFWTRGRVLWLACGTLIGLSPMIYFNLAHDFANLRWTLEYHEIDDGAPLWLDLAFVPIVYLPGLFVGRNIDRFQLDLPVTAYVESGLYLAMFLFMAIRHRRSLVAWVRACIPRPWPPGGARPTMESLLVVFVAGHVVMYAYSGGTSVSPRYLLPIVPALCFLTGRGLAELLWARGTGVRPMAALALTALVAIGLSNNVRYVRPAVLTYDVLQPDERGELHTVNVDSPAETLDQILQFLRDSQIDRVVCTSHLKWQLIFESNEGVIASSAGLIPGDTRYPPYDYAVRSSPRVALVFHKACEFNRRLRENENWKQSFRETEIGDFLIYVPVNQYPFVSHVSLAAGELSLRLATCGRGATIRTAALEQACSGSLAPLRLAVVRRAASVWMSDTFAQRAYGWASAARVS